MSRLTIYSTYTISRAHEPKERPTPHYSVQWHLTLNDYHTFLLWNYSQVGSLPVWSLRKGVRHARFRLMSDVDAGIDDSRAAHELLTISRVQNSKQSETPIELCTIPVSIYLFIYLLCIYLVVCSVAYRKCG